MLNVSENFKNALLNGVAVTAKVEIKVGSNETLLIDKSSIMEGGIKIDEAISSDTGFEIGTAIINKCDIEFYMPGANVYSLNGAEMKVYVGVEIEPETEWVLRGTYTIENPKVIGNIVKVEGYDNLSKFDKSYAASTLSLPASVLQIVNDACSRCGVALSGAIPNASMQIKDIPYAKAMSYRMVMANVAQMVGAYMVCNADGSVSIKEYSRTVKCEINEFRSCEISKDLKAITGVKADIKTVNSEGNETTQVFTAGDHGNMIDISDNLLITSENVESVIEYISGKMSGFGFYPATISIPENPFIEVGDLVNVITETGERKNVLITGLKYSVGGETKIRSAGETEKAKEIVRHTSSDIAAAKMSKDFVHAAYLEANYITADEIDAEYVKTEKLETEYANVETLNARYANIDFANVNVENIGKLFTKSGIIENLVTSSGTVTGELVGVTIKGDLIEGNTIKADKLVVKGSDGLYYTLNTDGEKVEAQQTDQNSLDGQTIRANTITASKIAVTDLVAFGATIGGFDITSEAIHSHSKPNVNNTTRGIYFDNDGQFAVGDADNFFKFFKDTDGNYKLEIKASTLKFSSGRSAEEAINQINNETANNSALLSALNESIPEQLNGQRESLLVEIADQYYSSQRIDEKLLEAATAAQAATDELNASLADYKTQMAQKLSSVDEMLGNLGIYFHVEADKLVVGAEGSPTKLYITNEQIIIANGDTPISYWQEGTMSVEQLISLFTIKIGNHLFEKYDSPIAAIGAGTILRRV